MTGNDAHAEVYIPVFTGCYICQKRELFTCYYSVAVQSLRLGAQLKVHTSFFRKRIINHNKKHEDNTNNANHYPYLILME